jgi:ACS family hexuronate transporter-like MFS transporter
MSMRAGVIGRWVPAFSMLLVSLISYIDRNTLALLAPTILKETHLSGEQYGYIISGFSIAYMIANPVWGRILDRIGLRGGMATGVACWTLASVAHVFASGFWSFAAARAALGFGEGATFPGGLRTVTQTLRADERGRGIAVAYSGGSLGSVITPLVVTPIFVWFGWRGAFWFTGLIGAAWLLLWTVVSRRPEMRGRPARSATATAAPRWGDRKLWAFMFAYALGALPLGFVIYNSALYLSRALGCSQEFIGKVLWVPPLGWEAGYFGWGWMFDRWSRRTGQPLRVLLRLLTACILLIAPFGFIPWMPGRVAVLATMFLAMFVGSGFVMLSVCWATKVYSADHSGLIAGIGAGSWGASVALSMPIFGRLFDQHRYGEAFALSTLLPAVGYALWYWLAGRETEAQAAGAATSRA